MVEPIQPTENPVSTAIAAATYITMHFPLKSSTDADILNRAKLIGQMAKAIVDEALAKGTK